MKLHLLRHAKTEGSSPTGKDFDRVLMTKGIIQSNISGFYFQERKIQFAETLCSDSIRTRQTLSIVGNFISCGKIAFLKDLYLADRETYLSEIWKLKHKKDILIVGHNDGISELASYFTDSNIHMKTCEYLCIEFKCDSWKETSVGMGSVTAEFRPQVYFPD